MGTRWVPILLCPTVEPLELSATFQPNALIASSPNPIVWRGSAVEIVPGLHQIRTPMNTPGLSFVMPYIFEEPDGVTLFDAGYGTNEATQAMTDALAERGRKPSDITRLIISHAHPDHLGMAGWVKEQSPNCELVMLEREWEWIRHRWLDFDHWEEQSNDWLIRHGITQAEVEAADRQGAIGLGGAFRSPGGLKRYIGSALGRLRNGDHSERSWRRSFRMDIEPDRVLQDGEMLEFGDWSLQAVWTPGHTPGHLCVYEPNHKLMLTGDHVLPRITPNVSMRIDDEETGRPPPSPNTSTPSPRPPTSTPAAASRRTNGISRTSPLAATS